MKNLKRLLLMGVVLTALSSCGKDNDSSGKKKSKDTPPVVTNTAANFKSYEQVKEAFTNMPMDHKTKDSDVIYHVGPEYSDYTPSGGFFNFNFTGCIDLGFLGSIGDCDQDTSQGQRDLIVQNGSYKIVTNANENSVQFELATGTETFPFDTVSGFYDQGSDRFIAMLNLDNKPTTKVVVSKATVTTEEGQNLKADFVEYFFEDGTIKGYVLSNSLGPMANPILITDGVYYGNGGSSQNIKGGLSIAGKTAIRSISVNTHSLKYQVNNNGYEIIDGRPLGMSFN